MTRREECIRSLRLAANRLGTSPTKAQYEALDLTPSAATILRHCESWNAAKESAGLATYPSTGPRVQRKPDDVWIPDDTDWEAMTQDQRWYYQNRVLSTRQSLDRRNRLRQWLHQVKAESQGCTRCGEPDPGCLEFHHHPDSDKEMAVNKMVPYGYSQDAIRAELEKCEIICANCHRSEHHPQPAGIEFVAEIVAGKGSVTIADLPDRHDRSMTKEEMLRAWTYAYQQDRGCAECDERDPVRLQFHHDGEKRMGIGAMISNSKPVEAVVTEVEACTVLCANCHRMQHYENPCAQSGESDKI